MKKLVLITIGVLLLGILSWKAIPAFLDYDARLATQGNTPLIAWGDSVRRVDKVPSSKDPYEFRDIALNDSYVDIAVMYSGCNGNTWDLYILEKGSSHFDLFLTHDNHGSTCTITSGGTVTFDLGQILSTEEISRSSVTFIDYHGTHHKVNED